MNAIKKTIPVVIVLSMMILFGACDSDDAPKEVQGWVPVYESELSDAEIKSMDPRTIANGGKIYVMNTRLYQVEDGAGIHIVDLTEPATPRKIAFITIEGAHEISIKGQYLYSNNYDDLVVIDISDINDVRLVKRMKNMFQFTNSSLPPERGYFECVDPAKGTVIDWKKTTIYSPKCKY